MIENKEVFAWIGRIVVAIITLAIPLLFGLGIGFSWDIGAMFPLGCLFAAEVLFVLCYASARREE